MVKSASDSTLLNGLSGDNLSTASTSEDEGVGGHSPTPPTTDRLAEIPSMVPKITLPNGSDEGSDVRAQKTKRAKSRTRTDPKSKTHPPCPNRAESAPIGKLSTDSNNFQSFPKHQEEEVR